MRADTKQFINGRIVGGYSLHETEKPELCPNGNHEQWRVVDCCGQEDDRDIIECSRCGRQQSCACSFDEDMS